MAFFFVILPLPQNRHHYITPSFCVFRRTTISLERLTFPFNYLLKIKNFHGFPRNIFPSYCSSPVFFCPLCTPDIRQRRGVGLKSSSLPRAMDWVPPTARQLPPGDRQHPGQLRGRDGGDGGVPGGAQGAACCRRPVSVDGWLWLWLCVCARVCSVLCVCVLCAFVLCVCVCFGNWSRLPVGGGQSRTQYIRHRQKTSGQKKG